MLLLRIFLPISNPIRLLNKKEPIRKDKLFFGAGDGISARGGLADKQSTGLFGPRTVRTNCFAIFSLLQIPSFHKTKKSLSKRINSFLELEMGFEPTAY